MDERLKFIARLLDGEKMAVRCRQFGISRKTVLQDPHARATTTAAWKGPPTARAAPPPRQSVETRIVHAPTGSPAHDLLPLFAPHDSGRRYRARFLMRRFESSRPKRTVCL